VQQLMSATGFVRSPRRSGAKRIHGSKAGDRQVADGREWRQV